MNAATRMLWWTGAAAAALTGAAVAVPAALRSVDAYSVTRVELTGARYLTAAEVMAVAGITESTNVFDDMRVWHAALRAHPLVLDVRIERRPPATVRFHVTEAEPVALVHTPVLRMVDTRGRVLPVDPAGHDLDLPIVAADIRPGPDSVLDGGGRRVLGTIAVLLVMDAAFARDISEIAPAAGGGVRLLLKQYPDMELLLPDAPDARVLHQLRLTLEHIRDHEAANEVADAQRTPARGRLPRRVDARYHDEIFVTMHARRTS